MKIPAKVIHLFWALANRGGGMVLQFGSVWMVARAVGVAGVGFYSFYTAWMMVLAALAGFGSATYTIRTVSVFAKQGHHAAIRQYLRKMAALLVGAGLLLVMLIGLLGQSFVAWGFGNEVLIHQIVWASLGAVSFMLMRLMSETLKALSLLNTAMVIESMLIPILLIALCTVALHNDMALTVEVVIGSHIAFMLVGTLVMLGYVLQATRVARQPGATTVDVPLWNSSMLPMWGSSLLGMLFLNMPLLLLPSFANPQEMGLFAIAYRFINICVTLLMVVGGMYGPRFAKEYADADPAALRQSLKQTRWFSMALYAPLFVVFVAVPEFVMGLFGDAFRSGGMLLLAMAVGQLIYASTGLAGLMMNMIHREKEEFWITLVATLLMAALIAGLGSQFSVLGIAIGFGAGLGLKNLMSWWMVNRYLALMKTPAGLAGPQR
jgi:O-antigen/teichoic acid export membrane protein